MPTELRHRQGPCPLLVWYKRARVQDKLDSDPPSSQEPLEQRLDAIVPAHSARPGALLIVVRGPQVGQRFLLRGDSATIGRGPQADIPLEEEYASTAHAQISSLGDGSFMIQDLSSRNGTLLNGRPTLQHRLANHDIIQIGETALSFLVASEESATGRFTPSQAHVSRTSPLAIHVQQPPGLARSSYSTQLSSYRVEEPQGNDLLTLLKQVIKLWRLLRRHGWLLVSLPLLGAALTGSSLIWWPAPDLAKARVRLTHERATNPVENGGHREETLTFFAEPLLTFNNPDLVRKSLEQVGVQPTPELVAATEEALEIEHDKSNLYVVSYWRAPGPEFGPGGTGYSVEAFLGRYLDNYLTSEIDKAIRGLQSEATFVGNQLTRVGQELAEVETELQGFKSKHIDSLPEQAGTAFADKALLSTDQARLEADVQRLRLQIKNTKEVMKEGSSIVAGRVADTRETREALSEKKRELASMEARGLKQEHPAVKRVKQEIGGLERELRTQMSSQVTSTERQADTTHQSLGLQLRQYQTDLQVAEQELASVDTRLAAARGRVAAVPEVEVKIQQLGRRFDSLQRLQTQLFAEHRKLLLQVDLETAAVRAHYEIESPVARKDGRTPKFYLIRFGLGLALGLVFALLIVAISEARRMLKQNPHLLEA